MLTVHKLVCGKITSVGTSTVATLSLHTLCTSSLPSTCGGYLSFKKPYKISYLAFTRFYTFVAAAYFLPDLKLQIFTWIIISIYSRSLSQHKLMHNNSHVATNSHLGMLYGRQKNCHVQFDIEILHWLTISFVSDKIMQYLHHLHKVQDALLLLKVIRHSQNWKLL